jgi:hypothetical protein
MKPTKEITAERESPVFLLIRRERSGRGLSIYQERRAMRAYARRKLLKRNQTRRTNP